MVFEPRLQAFVVVSVTARQEQGVFANRKLLCADRANGRLELAVISGLAVLCSYFDDRESLDYLRVSGLSLLALIVEAAFLSHPYEIIEEVASCSPA